MKDIKTTFRPILFSTPMVQAILQNRKTMTRRTKGLEKVNLNPNDWKLLTAYDRPEQSTTSFYYRNDNMYFEFMNGRQNLDIKCPYNIGDVLWVRETFELVPVETSSVYNSNSVVENKIQYRADGVNCFDKWKPSLFMPKQACRIFLKIKDIRVERLWDISKEDAISEGIEFKKIDHSIEYKNYMAKSKEFTPFNDYSFPGTPTLSFISLWELINGKENLEWNPFVWIYEFEQIEKPLNFI